MAGLEPSRHASAIECSFMIDAPIARVFAFHLDTRNAARISPPGQRVLSVEGTFPLRLDSEVRLRVRQLPCPWRRPGSSGWCSWRSRC